MPYTKINSNCKDSICEVKVKENVDLMESLNWSLLEKRIGDDLNNLESAQNSGLSSDITRESSKEVFETFTLNSSNPLHLTTPNISSLNVSTGE